MRTGAVAVLFAAVAGISQPAGSREPKPRLLISPAVLTAYTDQRFTHSVTVLGDVPFPLVMELLSENVDLQFVRATFSIWNGNRQFQLNGSVSTNYFVARSQTVAERHDNFRADVRDPFGNMEPWDGEMTFKLVLRYPNVEDFYKEKNDAVRQKVEASFGRADGKIVLQQSFRVRLTCMCQA